MKKTIPILIFILAIVPKSSALNRNQIEILLICEKYANWLNIEPSLVQGVAYQETLLGLLRGRSRQYFGIMQIKPFVVTDMIKIYDLREYQKLKKKDIIRLLKKDDEFNIMIGALYLKWLSVKIGDIDKVILAYNRGIGCVRKYGLRKDPHKYLEGVNKKIDVINKREYVCYI